MKCNSARELVTALQEIAAKFGKRYLLDSTPIATGDKVGPPDPEAWYDCRLAGLVKLNCFFTVPQPVYDRVKKAPWAPASLKRVQKAAARRPDGKMTKGADGLVLCDGAAMDAALEVLRCLGGTNLQGEHFEAALYENYLYKPVLCNLELKLVSDRLTNQGFPEQALSINAHIGPG